MGPCSVFFDPSQMSSRLIILPKKSYCPWKPENVQRVLRDQEQHRREAEDATQAEERRARREALSQQQEQLQKWKCMHRFQPP